jgi:hypothetical protein
VRPRTRVDFLHESTCTPWNVRSRPALRRLIEIGKPTLRLRYDLLEISEPNLRMVLEDPSGRGLTREWAPALPNGHRRSKEPLFDEHLFNEDALLPPGDCRWLSDRHSL